MQHSEKGCSKKLKILNDKLSHLNVLEFIKNIQVDALSAFLFLYARNSSISANGIVDVAIIQNIMQYF